MSVKMLEEAAGALGQMTDEVVFLGAATLPLWISDPGSPPLRVTADVDVVVEVTTLIAYNRFEQRLRDAGFQDEGTVLGRFLFGPENTRQLDAIPADGSILGFHNQWQRASLPAAVTRTLPSGARIRTLPPPNLLATKLEAFAGRGKGDFLGSQDFEDIIALIDGREELLSETAHASTELQEYVASQLSKHISDPKALEAVVAHLEIGREARQRADSVVLPRLRTLASAPGGISLAS